MKKTKNYLINYLQHSSDAWLHALHLLFLHSKHRVDPSKDNLSGHLHSSPIIFISSKQDIKENIEILMKYILR